MLAASRPQRRPDDNDLHPLRAEQERERSEKPARFLICSMVTSRTKKEAL